MLRVSVRTDNKETLNEITDMLAIHSCLCPFLFNDDDMLFHSARERLMTIARFAMNLIFPFFPNIKLFDIVLSGSICGYTYNQESDLDIFFVVDDLVQDNYNLNSRIFDDLSTTLNHQTWRPFYFGHPVDVNFAAVCKYRYMHNTYSILNNKWISKPAKLQHLFTEKDLYMSYSNFAQNIQKNIDQYPKNEDGELNNEGISNLRRLLVEQKLIAFDAKEKDMMHEYSLIYNTYRIAKKFKLFEQCYEYIDNLRQRKK